jgi:hypothetical protein
VQHRPVGQRRVAAQRDRHVAAAISPQPHAPAHRIGLRDAHHFEPARRLGGVKPLAPQVLGDVPEHLRKDERPFRPTRVARHNDGRRADQSVMRS